MVRLRTAAWHPSGSRASVGRLGFERLVVVKMILPQYSQDPRFQEMFLDEARIASLIEHSNVARILDVGEHDGNYFIVMEWVDGDSLSKVLRTAEQRKQRIPAGVALRICADAAAGLHAAHELVDRDGHRLGVVHRDVSPQNVLVSNNGATMLIDFGVAKARDRVSQDTSAGQLKGKIRYMAPEQALGKVVDHRADIWALGAILYELFTSNPPYDGPNEVAILHKLTSGAPPPALPPSVPAPVRAVIERAVSYDPDHRYHTAMELNLALESAMVEINETTSQAVIAQYTGHLLSDRKASRRKAVDAALTTARQRDRGLPTSSPTLAAPIVAPPPSPSGPSGVVMQGTPTNTSRPPSGPPSLGPMGLGEQPSNASNATLGSAAMEYPPLDENQRNRRRLMGAGILGISIVGGVVGIVLIVSSLHGRNPDGATTQPPSATLLPATTQESAPPAEPLEPPPGLPAAPVTAAAATPDPTPRSSATTAPHRAPPIAPPATPVKPKPTATTATPSSKWF